MGGKERERELREEEGLEGKCEGERGRESEGKRKENESGKLESEKRG